MGAGQTAPRIPDTPFALVGLAGCKDVLSLITAQTGTQAKAVSEKISLAARPLKKKIKRSKKKAQNRKKTKTALKKKKAKKVRKKR
jgi:hypothetical protein